MPDLKKLQTQFQEFLLNHNSQIAHVITATEKITVEDRLNIYRNGYYWRLIEAIEQEYPVLKSLLANVEFEKLARSYIDANPSSFRSLRWYGNQLAKFLLQTPPYNLQLHLAEMAKFEWCLSESFDAADSTTIDETAMTKIPSEKWPGLSFILHPSVRTLELQWNTIAVWKSIKSSGEILVPCLNKQPESWIFWRQAFEVHFCLLSVTEFYFLVQMQEGTKFSAICEGLCEWISQDEVALHAVTILKKFISMGIIISVSLL